MRGQTGFTLIEIAIVLVIIGLLLGGVLKGQELVTSARVRNLISQQDGAKAAYFGFLDRFRALPGDYGLATTNIAGATANGNANNQIEFAAAACAAPCQSEEYIVVWEHLSRAGFINGSYTFAPAPETPASVPANPYGAYIQMLFDNAYGTGPVGPPVPLVRHTIKTGNRIPSKILTEIDRKIDDGDPLGGAFQFSAYNGGAGGTAPVGAGTCYQAGPPPTWTASTVSNCGGATLLQ
ncbi:MAG TPA: prepilin-type N-terminal cleavage/methylation domain-containing protein [Burkholderiales bacterium]|nr:prepilin-type N-terminal cleavage/methylation domain-containing protein [Burkholderiales bacterium]